MLQRLSQASGKGKRISLEKRVLVVFPLLCGCPASEPPAPPQAPNLTTVLELGARSGSLDTDLAESVRDQLQLRQGQFNLRQMGLRPLLFIGPDALGRFRTFIHDIRNYESLFFANFGADGFLLAKKEEQGTTPTERQPVEWATLQVSRGGLPGARTGLYAAARASQAEVPSEFLALPSTALDLFLGTQPKKIEEQNCRLASMMSDSWFELIEHEKTTCALSRAPRDDRYPEGERESRVVCLHKEGKSLLDAHLDKVQFALPSANGEEIVFYEGSFRPPSITRLKLSSLELVRQQRTAYSLREDNPKPQRMIPDSSIAIYLCGGSSVESSQRPVWLLEEADLAKGVRLPGPGDRAWLVTDASDGGLLVDSRPWSDAVPPLDSLPPPRCVMEPQTDALCGLTILRRAVALAGEILKGSHTNPSIRAPLLLVAFQSLRHVERGLGGWLLERETSRLLELFGNEILQKMELLSNLPQGAAEAVRARIEHEIPIFRDHDRTEVLRLRALVGAPDAFWKALLGEEPAGQQPP